MTRIMHGFLFNLNFQLVLFILNMLLPAVFSYSLRYKAYSYIPSPVISSFLSGVDKETNDNRLCNTDTYKSHHCIHLARSEIPTTTTSRRESNFGNSLENSPVLVLNADYQPLSHLPLSLWSWQDALRAVMSEKAVVVSEYNLLVRSVKYSLKLPSVIAMSRFHKKPDATPYITKKLVTLRDSYTCQVLLKYFVFDLIIFIYSYIYHG